MRAESPAEQPEFRVVGIKGRTELSANHWTEVGTSKTLCGRDYARVLDVPFRKEDCTICATALRMREAQSRCSHDGPLEGNFCGYCYAHVMPERPKQYLKWSKEMDDAGGLIYPEPYIKQETDM